MFDEPFTGDVIMRCCLNILFQAFTLWIIHICITKTGLIFVDAEILRGGNEQLLNQLEEGVIILQEETKDTLFANLTAQSISINKSKNESIMKLFQNSTVDDVKLDLQIFAPLDTKIFEQTIVDTIKVKEYIQSRKDYMTLNGVIDAQLKETKNFATDRDNIVYKVHDF